MSEDFIHLHVASGYSMRHGASTPAALVERAAAFGQPALALTDRDGLYGAVKFVQACTRAQVDPVLGVDLALDPAEPVLSGESARARREPVRRSPVRGGLPVDPRHPRVTVLARGSRQGQPPGHGWGRLCRLVTETHLRGDRGTPMTTPRLVAEHAADDALYVLLGPDSDVGRAALHRRRDEARALLDAWIALCPKGSVIVETVCHGGPEGSPASLGHAARMLALAREAGVPCVLTAAVRHADPGQAPVVDVLDAARRLVPLTSRHLDRTTSAGHLAPSPAMWMTALDVVQASGPGISGGGALAREGAEELVRTTREIGLDCVQHPGRDLGIGAVHLPEPSVLGLGPLSDPQHVLARRCRESIATRYPGRGERELAKVSSRLEDELGVIDQLGYPTYFLTVAQVCDLIRDMGVRVAARGSGAGSLVNYLLGISGVDPIRHDLLMERFCSPLRAQLPDIDIDVESARRTEIYERILERFGGDRVTCVSMMDSYRVRHAIRDVGAALGVSPGEVDAMAKAFPHISARNVRNALAELPELRSSGLDAPRLQLMLDLVESLDGLPRHIALHPCGVILSNAGLLDRTPVEASWLGFPMSQFDKDDVEELGLLKLDVLGIRMQSAMAHAVDEVKRVDGVHIELDDEGQVPHDDEPTFRMIRTTHTLGCFQIESPGQRELIGKLGPEAFEDLIVDISLFRPGPVKSDMIVPFLNARHGWSEAEYLHDSLVPALRETQGVVVFHEQVLRIFSATTGVSLAHSDEARRAMGTPEGQEEVERWWRPAAEARGYSPEDRDRIWEVLRSFASFGFCKAHAAAFALPTYQSAWLKAHHPAAFLAGVLTHDPGMYPKRLILDDARSLGITVLGIDVNRSDGTYRLERLPEEMADAVSRSAPEGCPDGRGTAIRLSLTDVRGISEAEVARIIAGQPYQDLADFWRRARVSRPVVERLVLAGGFDEMHGIRLVSGDGSAVVSRLGRRGQITRRDLLLHVADLDRWDRGGVAARGRRPASRVGRGTAPRTAIASPHAAAPTGGAATTGTAPETGAGSRVDAASRVGAASRVDAGTSAVDAGASAALPTASAADAAAPSGEALLSARDPLATRQGAGIAERAAAQAQGPAAVPDEQPTQLTLDIGAPTLDRSHGLPELTGPEVVRAELDILGLDASGHVASFYAPMLDALGTTRAEDLLRTRTNREIWVAGVKVATQTPPIRSGRRVIFLTLDDTTGPVDVTFFEDVQGPYAATVFHSWMLLVRGVLRRTGDRGVSVRATGAWELGPLWQAWTRGGEAAARQALAAADLAAHERSRALADAVADRPDAQRGGPDGNGDPQEGRGTRRRVLVHASGYRQSPYADVRPAGPDVRGGAGSLAGDAPRKLWHSSPGSAGH